MLHQRYTYILTILAVLVLLLIQGIHPSSAASNMKEVESTDSTLGATAVTAITSDDFDTCSLNSIWTFQEGQTGDPAPAFDGTNLVLSVPEGIDHDIWEDGIFASRVVQALPEGDFGVEVKFNSEMEKQFQTRGIIVEDGTGNAVRLEIFHDGAIYWLYAATISGGVVTEQYSEEIGTSNPMYMRAQRTGTTWTQSYSLDGTTWTIKTFEDAFIGTLIGPYIGNTSTDPTDPEDPPPAHTGLIDYFYDMANPGPGDSGLNSYTLTITPDGGGTVTQVPDKPSYGCSEEVTLTAVPVNAGYAFSSWGGNATGTDNPLIVTMDEDKTITATFIETGVETYTLTVNTSGNGSVTKSLDQETYPAGTIVTLTAEPDEGWQFDSWSGNLTGNTNPTTITMDANKTVTATFSEIPPGTYTLTVTTEGNGTVIKSPNQASYTAGTVVTLTPVPNTDWVFTGWSGDATGTTTPLQVTMNSNMSIKATFTETFELNTDVIGLGQVIVTPDQERYIDGTVVTVTAVPNTDWLFNSWYGDLSGQQNPTQVTMDKDHSIIANFVQNPAEKEFLFLPYILKPIN
ncbi:MAG: InlB B-repeat-containing protein [Candidatus Promineifilaceae bacterium]